MVAALNAWVTVSITRRFVLGKSAEIIAWVRAGATLAREFPGFLAAAQPDGRYTWHPIATRELPSTPAPAARPAAVGRDRHRAHPGNTAD